jgi:hypothetical protein
LTKEQINELHPPLFSVCGMNKRRQIKKQYGLDDLVSVGTQTLDIDFPVFDDKCVVKMRTVYSIVDKHIGLP